MPRTSNVLQARNSFLKCRPIRKSANDEGSALHILFTDSRLERDLTRLVPSDRSFPFMRYLHDPCLFRRGPCFKNAIRDEPIFV